MMAATRTTIRDLVSSIRQRKRSAADVIHRTLQRIEQENPRLNAFRELYPEHAVDVAQRIDESIAHGNDPGPLAGVPIAVKDNIVTSFGTTTCGSRILENYRSPFTATAVQRLIDAGAIIVGKTNCDEFAMGSSGENCAYGPTRNPADTARVTGGSSGGSAAAVAAGLTPASLGSETGGSVRQPASFCGVVGVKPSYGRISRYGLVAFGSSLDQIGPFAGNVTDAALLTSIMAGLDELDSTCVDASVPAYASAIESAPAKLRLGLPKQHVSHGNDAAVEKAMEEAIATFRDAGAEIVEVDLPLTDYGIATYYVIATAEASSNLARYDGIRYGRRAVIGRDEDLFDLYAKSRAEGFGPEVQRRIMLGTYVLSAGYYDAYYKRALQVRRLIKQDYDRVFTECDAIIGPTSPIPAFRIGEKADPLTMYMCDVYTTNASSAGICAISVPCGAARVDGADLPIGLQIQCPAFAEERLFQVARVFERERGGSSSVVQ